MASKDIKDMAGAQAKAGGEWVKQRWTEFREESPYFQAKVGVVVAWVVIAVLTVFVAPPPTAPFNVRVIAQGFGLLTKTALVIENVKYGDVEGATIVVEGSSEEFGGKVKNGEWQTRRPIDLIEGEKATIQVEQLFDLRGNNPAISVDIHFVSILDEDGDEILRTIPSRPTDKKKK